MTRWIKAALLLSLVAIVSVAMTGCEGDEGQQGPAGPAGTASCADCHNDTNIISGKKTQWMESAHGMGEAYLRGTRSSCAGCHSGNTFAQIAGTGVAPNEVTEGDPAPTRQDCRACHMIHETYTTADWGRRGTGAVDFYAVDGATYDGGAGNLCANCHQPRRTIADPVNGVISGITTHWGPHHGGQGSMLLGVAGAGDVQGSPSTHYQIVDDTCVACHMGEEQDHTFEPDVSRCQVCHSGAEDFDINGVQTEVQQKMDELRGRLFALGLLDSDTDEAEPAEGVTEAPEAQAIALWNWLYIAHEDGSLGVHNPDYTIDLLDASLALIPPQ